MASRGSGREGRQIQGERGVGIDDDKPNETLEQLLANMSPREARVLRERFGDSYSEMVRSAGEQLESARARIRELERRASDRSPDDDGPDDAA